MKVSELIEKLQALDSGLEVMFATYDYDWENVEAVEVVTASFYRGGPDETVVVMS